MNNFQIYEQIEKLTSDIEWRISTGLRQDRFGGEKIDGWFILAQLRKIQLMIAESMIGQKVPSDKTSPAGPAMQDKMLEQCADMIAEAVSDLPKYQRKHVPINEFDMSDLLTLPPDEPEDSNKDFITAFFESMEPDKSEEPEKKKDRHNRKDQKPSPKSMAGNMSSEYIASITDPKTEDLREKAFPQNLVGSEDSDGIYWVNPQASPKNNL